MVARVESYLQVSSFSISFELGPTRWWCAAFFTPFVFRSLYKIKNITFID